MSPDSAFHKRKNLRSPEVMDAVQSQVAADYGSELVESLRSKPLIHNGTTIHVAEQFGFCYGVQRAIHLIYAARESFPDTRIFLLGEIIHNPEVNARIEALGVVRLAREITESSLQAQIGIGDVVVIPAFGIPLHLRKTLDGLGCHIVDTTCGDVMSVWRQVRRNAKEGITSIIHGKASHEEILATISQAQGGHYLVISNESDCAAVCDFVRQGGATADFLTYFAGAHSENFDPAQHLVRIGMANQTTMLRNETQKMQMLIRAAIIERDGDAHNFQALDTVCGATQERQDALIALLDAHSLDFLLVIGGYNSSNTAHLVQIGKKRLPTFFIRDESCLVSPQEIRHFDITSRAEIVSQNWLPPTPHSIGITAGASCPASILEAVIERLRRF